MFFPAGEQRRGHDLSENIQNIEHIPIGHQGQVNVTSMCDGLLPSLNRRRLRVPCQPSGAKINPRWDMKLNIVKLVDSLPPCFVWAA